MSVILIHKSSQIVLNYKDTIGLYLKYKMFS